MNSVLLIGANGLLGSHVNSLLNDAGFDVTPVSRRSGFDIGVKRDFSVLGYEFDYVLNLAAIVEVAASQVEDAVRINGIGALHAAEFSRQAGAMYVNASTISTLPCGSDYNHSYYAISKRLGEELARRYCDDNEVVCAVLRFPQLYSSTSEAEKYQPMLYRIARQLKNENCATLYGENNPLRNYLHVDDAAAAILVCMKAKQSGGWNCVHPESTDIEGLIKMYCEAIGIPVCINRLCDRENIPELEIPRDDLFHLSHPEWEPRELGAGLRDIVASV